VGATFSRARTHAGSPARQTWSDRTAPQPVGGDSSVDQRIKSNARERASIFGSARASLSGRSTTFSTVKAKCLSTSWDGPEGTVGRHPEHVALKADPSVPRHRCGRLDREPAAQGRRQDRVAVGQSLMNASRSALIVSACVVGMPCGKPL
jgi:hypothetical protein